MIEILAEGGIGTQEAVVGGLVLTLLGWVSNSGYSIILTKRGSGKNGNGKTNAIDRDDCDRRHAAEAALRTVENAQLVKSIDKLDASVTRLHTRIDEYLRKE
jgi:hypothetical protein